jgi:hypothetical protein
MIFLHRFECDSSSVPHCESVISPEVYEARFAAALLLDEMRRPWPDVLDALSRLHEWRPTKADAIYYLGGTQWHAEWRPASQLFHTSITHIN